MKSRGMMDGSSGTRSVRLRGLSVALMLLSTCACTDCADHNVTAEFGETAVLPCECPSNKPPFVAWQRTRNISEPDIVVNYYRGEDDKEDHQTAAEYLNRTELKQLTGRCFLELRSVRLSDEGLYKCYHHKLPLRYDNIYLHVTDKGHSDESVQKTVTAVSSSVAGILVIVMAAVAVYVGIACRKRYQMNGFIATQGGPFNSCR